MSIPQGFRRGANFILEKRWIRQRTRDERIDACPDTHCDTTEALRALKSLPIRTASLGTIGISTTCGRSSRAISILEQGQDFDIVRDSSFASRRSDPASMDLRCSSNFQLLLPPPGQNFASYPLPPPPFLTTRVKTHA
jgi:hypothetical protein